MTDVDMLREAATHLRALAAVVGNPNPYARPDLNAALADWLEAEADHHEARDRVVDAATDSGEWYVRLSASTLPQAVAVARVVLGGQP
ncbi:hypothetical protein GCM10011608_09290 [Micromonospora sonchi]|uniref:Uncharacterized protein n=1 Tax=Micromonospora sonchi TaxID=1763543 RepID=A0A917TLN8_9ACTN|nr:hypothetical protein [Micromonospora sonchi]GGM26611.1 hypothetical protein GCM10011608_09290 [Micromonospora sonchi]